MDIPLEIEFLTIDEVCKTCHITRQTLRRWGRIPPLCFPPALRLGPGTVRYRLSDLVKWTAWLRAQADAKAAGLDPNEVPRPSYVQGAWRPQVTSGAVEAAR